MKVLLVKPFSWNSAKGLGFPLSLAYLASSLLAAGEEVKVLDLQVVEQEHYDGTLFSTLSEFEPDIVGITCNSHERFYSFDIARKIKVWKDVPVIMGGPHVTFTAEETLQHVSEVDIIILHEGEDAIVEITKAISSGKSLKSVKGIVFRENGTITRTTNRDFIENLDRLPPPARELFNVDKYDLYLPIGDRPKAMHLLTSRGCPFACGFCSAKEMSGRKVRFSSPDRVVEEMKSIKEHYPQYSWLFFYDDHLTLKKTRVLELCEKIRQSGLDYKWGCYGRVDSIDEEIVDAMKSAGCRMISFGVESGSTGVLKKMQKGIKAQMIENALGIVKKKGLIARASFIFGYPGETMRDFFETILLCRRIGLDSDELIWNFNPVIYPSTSLLEIMKERGYINREFTWCKRSVLPEYKDVPVFISSTSKIKEIMGRGYKKFFVAEKDIPLYKSTTQYVIEQFRKRLHHG